MNQANILPTGVKVARESENKKKRSRFFPKIAFNTHNMYIFANDAIKSELCDICKKKKKKKKH